jgi:hypothetical protein
MPNDHLAQVNTSLPQHIIDKIDAIATSNGISRAAAMRQIITWHLAHASGALVHVVPGDDLQGAIDSCPPGGTIVVAPGTYTVDKPLVIPNSTITKGSRW